MKICTIIGARPQFIKAAAVSRAIATHNSLTPNASPLTEVIIHTGQHYDDGMSAVFFRELEIPEPKYNLAIGSGSHGAQTGQMLAAIEKVLIKEKPDWVLIYGDTNSTLAGALAAAKLHIPIAHVEAGLRSFNRRMPEEINRVVADQLSTLLLCPSQIAVDNLAAEGIGGNAMVRQAHHDTQNCHDFHVCHPELVEGRQRHHDTSSCPPLEGAGGGSPLASRNGWEPFPTTPNLEQSSPVEHRTLNLEQSSPPLEKETCPPLEGVGGGSPSPKTSGLKLIPPLGYFDIIALEKSARILLTDSGGMQKEAYWLKVPCITLRDETEWVETVASGWNILTGAERDRIVTAVQNFKAPATHPPLYGDGQAAEKILSILCQNL
jgi:UDP-GlcNAc3NAcA epimerase